MVDPADIPTAEQLEDLPSSMVVQAYEIKRALNAYLAGAPGDHPRSLAELIAFNRAHADRELRYVRQDGLEAVHQMDFTEREYRQALAVTNHRLSRAEGHRCGAAPIPPGRAGDADHRTAGQNRPGPRDATAAVRRPPPRSPDTPRSASRRASRSGLPVGLTFMGTAWSEPALLRIAYAYEQAGRVRRPPTYRPADIGF